MSPLTDAQVRELRERAAKGESDAALATAYGLTLRFVGSLRLGRRRPEAGGPLTRMRCPRRPVAPLVPAILAALETGLSYDEIAELVGTSPTSVFRVARSRGGAS